MCQTKCNIYIYIYIYIYILNVAVFKRVYSDKGKSKDNYYLAMFCIVQ